MSDYKNTIFKASYWFRDQLMNLFVNYDVGGHKTFSFVVMKQLPGKPKYSYIYNLNSMEENLAMLKNMINSLPAEEQQKLLKQIILKVG